MPDSHSFAPAYDDPHPRNTMPNWKLEGSALVEDLDAPDEPSVEPVDEGFDPAGWTIEQVKGFVERNPNEAEAVFSAEVDGKNRSTLTSWLIDFVLARDAEVP